MERKRESILNTLLKKKKKEKISPFQLKNEHRDDDSTSAESPIKIKISQTKSMTEKEFETAVREHRRKMSKKYLTKQVSTFCLSNGNSELLYSGISFDICYLQEITSDLQKYNLIVKKLGC